MNLLNKPTDDKITIDSNGNMKFSNEFISSFGLNVNSTCSFIESDDFTEPGLKTRAFFISFDPKVPYGTLPTVVQYKEFVNEIPFYFRLSDEALNQLKERFKFSFENGVETLTLGKFKAFEIFGGSIGYKLIKRIN